MSRVITLMPVRLASTRLPGKPLLKINGKTCLEHVFNHVKQYLPNTDIAIAAGDQEIVDECNKIGAKAILTDPKLPSGTDRIAAALKVLDPDGTKYDIVVDFQGDNINVNPQVNLPLIEMVERTGCDIATCAVVINNEADKTNPAVVKVIMGLKEGETEAKCLYFTRATAPFTRNPEKCKNQDLYQHIGIYVFRADALQKMVSLPVGVLEEREALEQLRALENGMEIRAKLVGDIRINKNVPADINTPEDYEMACKYMED